MLENPTHTWLALLLCSSLAGGAGPALAEPLAADLQGQGMPAPLCEDGVVLDDGTNETGYGWVPSVVDGRYVQQFDSAMFPSRRIWKVCVCWLRTLADSDIDFEIEFYEGFVDDEGVHRPVDDPYAAFPVSASDVPVGVAGAQFFEFPTVGVTIPEGLSYVGVRWDASVDDRFFVCADSSRETPPVEVFFRDELAEGWGRALDTNDSTFVDHKALLLRVGALPPAPTDVPALGLGGLALLAAGLAGGALWVARRREGC